MCCLQTTYSIQGCFTDFPYPEGKGTNLEEDDNIILIITSGFGTNATAAQVYEYLNDFAEHFHLDPYFRLNTTVKHVKYDDSRNKWIVEIEGTKDQQFDKVVIASGGMVAQAKIPTIQGIEKFKGTCVHSRQIQKDQKTSKASECWLSDLRIVQADTATQLAIGNIASQVYLSHRHGNTHSISLP